MRLLYACTCVRVKVQEGDLAQVHMDITGYHHQESVGAKTEEFILDLHEEPVCLLEAEHSEMLCPLS